MKAERTQRKALIPVMYDPTDRKSPVIYVKADPRTKASRDAINLLVAEASKAKANENAVRKIIAEQINRNTQELDDFAGDWSGVTPRWLQKWLTGGAASYTDAQVAAMEAKLKDAGETEYEFDTVTYKDLLEDGPMFLARMQKLFSSLEALAEAEEAYRAFFSAATPGERTSSAA